MIRYIALLRGVNVGGNNKVSMKTLKECLEQNGYHDVVTYVNSGNVLFHSANTDKNKIKEHLEELLEKTFGFSIIVAIITGEELTTALSQAPEWWDNEEEVKHNALIVIPPVTAEEVFRTVGAHKPEYEKVASFGDVIFWSAPIKTFSRTRYSGIVGTSIYRSITIRNANTVKRLVELCKAAPKCETMK